MNLTIEEKRIIEVALDHYRKCVGDEYRKAFVKDKKAKLIFDETDEKIHQIVRKIYGL